MECPNGTPKGSFHLVLYGNHLILEPMLYSVSGINGILQSSTDSRGDKIKGL